MRAELQDFGQMNGNKTKGKNMSAAVNDLSAIANPDERRALGALLHILEEGHSEDIIFDLSEDFFRVCIADFEVRYLFSGGEIKWQVFDRNGVRAETTWFLQLFERGETDIVEVLADKTQIASIFGFMVEPVRVEEIRNKLAAQIPELAKVVEDPNQVLEDGGIVWQ